MEYTSPPFKLIVSTRNTPEMMSLTQRGGLGNERIQSLQKSLAQNKFYRWDSRSKKERDELRHPLGAKCT
jgi:hypothetical protein